LIAGELGKDIYQAGAATAQQYTLQVHMIFFCYQLFSTDSAKNDSFSLKRVGLMLAVQLENRLYKEKRD